MPMQPDMCVPCGDGFINLRVGAIIMKDDKILMAGNGWASYAYTVGGRLSKRRDKRRGEHGTVI